MSKIHIINTINFFRSKKYRVGFYIPNVFSLYHRAMASTRFRVYDQIIHFFNDREYVVELFNPFKRYDILIFQKVFSDEAVECAKKAKKNGTRIVLDLNVNYLDEQSKLISSQQRKKVHTFIEISDYILTTTYYIAKQVSLHFSDKLVTVIPENIETFGIRKKILSFQQDKIIRLVHVGHAHKLGDLHLISDQLKKLADKYPVEILILTNKRIDVDFGYPRLKVRTKKFNRWNQKLIFTDLTWGDIFIAPRDLTETYNLGHSFDKIGRPMSVGLPVIASPVPSYKDSPAILINNFDDTWREKIEYFLTHPDEYWNLSKKGIEYCAQYVDPTVVMRHYREFFDTITQSHD